MPKGVEHIAAQVKAALKGIPRNSVMPKGVEHLAKAAVTVVLIGRETP